MSNLIAFLNARLDEDEQIARAIKDHSDPWPGQWEADGDWALKTYNGWTLAMSGAGEFMPGLLAHIARHDPARVLREVEAKRAIIESQRSPYMPGNVPATVVLRHLAAIWSDHPDYRPEWKP